MTHPSVASVLAGLIHWNTYLCIVCYLLRPTLLAEHTESISASVNKTVCFEIPADVMKILHLVLARSFASPLSVTDQLSRATNVDYSELNT